MSKNILLLNRAFQLMRKQARELAKELKCPHHEALEVVSIRNDFDNWHQVKIAKNKYDELTKDYHQYPVFFWDIKDGLDMKVNEPWLLDENAFIFCCDLLWKKPRISKVFSEMEDQLAGFIYKSKWNSCEHLYSIASNLGFFEPEFVYLNGCIIPFESLRDCSEKKKDIERIETNFVVYDAIQPALDKLHYNMNSSIFNFSQYSIEAFVHQDVIDTVGWSYQQLSDYIIGQRVDEVVLISPPNKEEEGLSNIIGRHLVHTVKLDF